MKKILRRIYYSIIKFLPAKFVINIENILSYKRLFNKDTPQYFGEKIQWLKLYGNLEQYTDLVDKYKVREYIAKEIGEEYLIPLINIYNTPEEIDYNKLPNSFVLKVNHGSGYNIIVKDKSKIDISKINNQLNKWLKEDYSQIKKEFQYKNVKRKIICEEFINDKNGQLIDYKFFCFDGKPEFIKVDFDRFTTHKANIYSPDWKLLELSVKGQANYKGDCPKPINYKKMLTISKKLCRKFQFIRVDLYNVDGKIYFGELTFTPASGIHPFYPLEKDLKIAERIKLNHEK